MKDMIHVTLTKQQQEKLARWYDELEQLHKIEDPIKRAEAIKQFESQRTYDPDAAKIQ
jgi:hypothetical protein